ncbi:MAG: hypothetical protein R3D03_01290 [Geminicoccaceae bacterium]
MDERLVYSPGRRADATGSARLHQFVPDGHSRVALSTVLGALNGYVLTKWTFRGATVIFG